MFGVDICATAGPAASASAATAPHIIAPITLIGLLLRVSSRPRGGGYRAHSSAIRLAGFRRLRPVIPERAAFGAAREREDKGEHARDQRQTLQHERPHPAGCTPPARPRYGP